MDERQGELMVDGVITLVRPILWAPNEVKHDYQGPPIYLETTLLTMLIRGLELGIRMGLNHPPESRLLLPELLKIGEQDTPDDLIVAAMARIVQMAEHVSFPDESEVS